MTLYSAANFVPDTSIGYLVRRCHQLGHAGLEPTFAAAGLTGMQWSALVTVMIGRATTCAELARELSYDKGATTRLVDALEANGWMTRHRDDEDRRIVRLALTETGAELALRLRLEVVEVWNGWLDGWDADDAMQLIALLRRLRDTLDVAVTGEEA